MEIIVRRQHFNDVCTIGTLTIDGDDVQMFTLEDVDRHISKGDTIEQIAKAKVFGATCIPYGKYEVSITWSNKYKRKMPLIMNVPCFEGVRIHSGNKAEDTEGCLLVGYQKDVVNNRIVDSRAAISELYVLIDAAIAKEKVYISFVK